MTDVEYANKYIIAKGKDHITVEFFKINTFTPSEGLLLELSAIHNRDYANWCEQWHYDSSNQANKLYYDSLKKMYPRILKITGLTENELTEYQRYQHYANVARNKQASSERDEYFNKLLEKIDQCSIIDARYV